MTVETIDTAMWTPEQALSRLIERLNATTTRIPSPYHDSLRLVRSDHPDPALYAALLGCGYGLAILDEHSIWFERRPDGLDDTFRWVNHDGHGGWCRCPPRQDDAPTRFHNLLANAVSSVFERALSRTRLAAIHGAVRIAVAVLRGDRRGVSGVRLDVLAAHGGDWVPVQAITVLAREGRNT